MDADARIRLLAHKYNKNIKEFLCRLDGRIEWVCEHGIGHTVWAPRESPAWYVHGCDGCCEKLNEKEEA